MAAVSVKRSIDHIDAHKRENALIFYRILSMTTNFVRKCKRPVWGIFCMWILGVKGDDHPNAICIGGVLPTYVSILEREILT